MPTVQQLHDAAQLSTVDFGPFRLSVNLADGSGIRYRDELRRDELDDPLMRDIVDRVAPQMFVDLGANYGFTALLHHHYNPAAAIVAVEMSPLLVPFIRENFRQNGIERGTVVNAAVGAEPGIVRSKLNTFGSHDNRVVPSGGAQFFTSDTYEVSVVSVDQLLADLPASVPFMIKIDTQGYERHVFAGAARTLARTERWIIKTEFGPMWLRSQGTDPKQFLVELVAAYDVCELPQRSRFGDRLASLLRTRLAATDTDAFVDWIAGRARDGKGWCDLLVAPKGSLF